MLKWRNLLDLIIYQLYIYQIHKNRANKFIFDTMEYNKTGIEILSDTGV